MGRCGAVGSALQCGVQPGCVFGLKVCEVLLLLGCRWGERGGCGFFVCVCVVFFFFFLLGFWNAGLVPAPSQAQCHRRDFCS